MAPSIDAVATEIRRVLTLVATAHRSVALADRCLADAATAIVTTTKGSAAAEPGMVGDLLATAHTGLTSLLATLDAVSHHLQRYLTAIGAVGSPGEASLTAPDVRSVSSERIDALRAALPPPVVPNSGQKTHGRWIGQDGVAHDIVSGRDDDSSAAWSILQSRGLASRSEPLSISHVEQKVAARMVRQRIRHVTVVINNRPCRGRSSCDTLVPVILPPDTR